jgi:hypothetical protein
MHLMFTRSIHLASDRPKLLEFPETGAGKAAAIALLIQFQPALPNFGEIAIGRASCLLNSHG